MLEMVLTNVLRHHRISFGGLAPGVLQGTTGMQRRAPGARRCLNTLLPLEASAELPGAVTGGAGDGAEVWTSKSSIWIVPVMTVEDVEELGSQRHGKPVVRAEVRFLQETCILRRCCPSAPVRIAAAATKTRSV